MTQADSAVDITRGRRPEGRWQVLVLGANLATDRTLRLHRLSPGYVQRPHAASGTAGGKAVNVCRAAACLGAHPRLVANLPGRLGAAVGDLLRDEGHDLRPVVTSGEIRTAIIVIEDDDRVTVLNEPGPPLRGTDLDALVQAFTEEAAGHRWAIATGSLPPAAPVDLYGRLVARAHVAGCSLVVDAARDVLQATLPFGPDLVTPNLSEAQAVLAGEHGVTDEPVEALGGDVRAAALTAADALRSAGAVAALVTAGRYGVAGVSAGDRFWLPAPAVEEENPIGAGDAFAAGLALALEQGDDLRTAAARAVATASASVAHPMAGRLDPDLAAALLATLKPEGA
jgi:1-phosphofructokinase family hexose kinase